MRITRKATLAVGVGSAAAALIAGAVASASPALADPASGTVPRAQDIVGVGSDTTQNLFNRLSTDFNAQSPAPTNKLYSYDAFGSATITPKANCTAITRPAGSGAGITELKQNRRPSNSTTAYCVDFARSSRGPQASDAGLAFVRYAQDAVTWSKTSRSGAPSNAPASLSIKELRAIYSCDASILGAGATGPVKWNQVGGTSTAAAVPVLPQASSGTRSFFLSAIGVTTPGSCVSATTPEENQGTTPSTLFAGTSSPNLIFPYSVAVYLAQSQNGQGTGQQGSQVLGSAENTSGTVIAPTTGTAGALTINPALATVGLTRFVYNVVRGSTVPTYLQGLFGNNSNTGYVCTNATAQADIKTFGFRTIGSQCGTVTTA